MMPRSLLVRGAQWYFSWHLCTSPMAFAAVRTLLRQSAFVHPTLWRSLPRALSRQSAPVH